MSRSSVAAIAAALAAAAVTSPLAAQLRPKPLDRADMDTTCAPCRDFYQYANGGWLTRTTLPPDRSSWTGFGEVRDRVEQRLHALIEEIARAPGSDPERQQLARYYTTCMDSTLAERAGLAPLAPALAQLDTIATADDVRRGIVQLHRLGIDAGFRLSAAQDAKNTRRVIASVSQGGLGMPNREYYLRTDSVSVLVRQRYAQFIATLLRAGGSDSTAADAEAAAVLALETAIARTHKPAAALRDPEANYNILTSDSLDRAAPVFGWRPYLSAMRVAPGDVNVAQPAHVRALDSLLSAVPAATWRAYLRFHLLRDAAPWIEGPLARESEAFTNGVLRGIEQARPRWARCITSVDAQIGELLGKAYVARWFPPEAKRRVLEMIANIRAEMRERIGQLTWMSAPTRERAFAKLDAFTSKIGYPEKWKDYSRLTVVPGPFIVNRHAAAAYGVAMRLDRIGRPPERREWTGFVPQTVNASYSPRTNEITFPAGILQPPFFDPAADDAVNYGAIGAVIGHEISHGFDDQGRQSDAEGNLSGWWTKEDEEEFTARAEVLVRQYDGYLAVDSLYVNGRLTLGENIADFAGLTIAHGAFWRAQKGKKLPPIDGLTADQRFFLAYARVWRTKIRPAALRLQVTTDPHSPGPFRVMGPLANMPAFWRAFDCKPGDPMVRSGSELAEIW